MTQETIANIVADLLFDMEIDASEERLPTLELRPLYVEKLLDGLSSEDGLLVSTLHPAPKRPGKTKAELVRHFVHHAEGGLLLAEIREMSATSSAIGRAFQIIIRSSAPIVL